MIHHEEIDFVAEDGVGGCVGDYNFQTTRDGNTFVFLSNLTGTTADDTGLRLTKFGEAANNAIQVYRYDDETGYTECVSCQGTTEPATGGVSNGFGAATSLVGRRVDRWIRDRSGARPAGHQWVDRRL